MSLQASYDPQFDMFCLAEEGTAPEVVEIYPCVNLDLNPAGRPIGVEVFRAAEKLLGEAIIGPLLKDGEFCQVPLKGSLADLDAQLRPAYGQEYQDYLEVWPDCTDDNHPEARKALEILRSGIAALLEQVKAGTGIT